MNHNYFHFQRIVLYYYYYIIINYTIATNISTSSLVTGLLQEFLGG